jgi:hypothetical protein
VQRTETAIANPLVSDVVTTDPDTGANEFPAYAWEMNYYPDNGAIGGTIRFEIDNTALHVWSTVAHAGALPPAERATFLAGVWPSLRDALDLLRRWRDKKTGLQWPANEDDHMELSSTLHGATAVYAALRAGARLAAAMGDGRRAGQYRDRADELHAAILRTYYDSKTGLFQDTAAAGSDYIPGTTGLGSTAWLAWPARVLESTDPRLERQLASDMTAVMPDIRGETEGGAYVMKNVMSAALLGADGGSRDQARDAVTRIAQMATPDTDQFGEVFITTHPDGASGPVFSTRVAAPHVWEGMLFYLAAMALTDPSKFDHDLVTMPPPPAAGCGCRAGGATAPGLGLALALAGAILGCVRPRRGRRRGPR